MQSINFIIAIMGVLLAIYGAVLSTINQLQIRRQMQQILIVKMDPTGRAVQWTNPQGNMVAALTIQVVNSGLRPVMLKEAGLILPNGTLFNNGVFSDAELVSGADCEANIDVGEVLPVIKRQRIIDNKVVVRGYFMTPLRRYESKKIRLDIKLLENDVERFSRTRYGSF